jgi:hypothetical protein
MDDALSRKAAANEDLFRQANEAIERGLWPGDEDRVIRFRCECADMQCSQVVELTVREYERVRDDPRQFVVLEGHELPQVERVVDRGPGHTVVEKEGEAGEVAEDRDPRS